MNRAGTGRTGGDTGTGRGRGSDMMEYWDWDWTGTDKDSRQGRMTECESRFCMKDI